MNYMDYRWIEYFDQEYLNFSYKCGYCGKDALTKAGTHHDQVLTPFCPYCGKKLVHKK